MNDIAWWLVVLFAILFIIFGVISSRQYHNINLLRVHAVKNGYAEYCIPRGEWAKLAKARMRCGGTRSYITRYT
jgi:hypothetical protein